MVYHRFTSLYVKIERKLNRVNAGMLFSYILSVPQELCFEGQKLCDVSRAQKLVDFTCNNH
jgi:hypothetical protein